MICNQDRDHHCDDDVPFAQPHTLTLLSLTCTRLSYRPSLLGFFFIVSYQDRSTRDLQPLQRRSLSSSLPSSLTEPQQTGSVGPDGAPLKKDAEVINQPIGIYPCQPTLGSSSWSILQEQCNGGKSLPSESHGKKKASKYVPGIYLYALEEYGPGIGVGS